MLQITREQFTAASLPCVVQFGLIVAAVITGGGTVLLVGGGLMLLIFMAVSR